MEKRALLAVILSLIVILLYQYLFVSQQPTVKSPLKEKKISREVQKSLPSEHLRPEKNKFIGKDISRLLEEQKREKPKDIVIETNKYRAVINTAGARITGWKLKDYFLTEEYENVPWKMSFWTRVANSYKSYFSNLFKPQKHKEKKCVDLFRSLDSDSAYGLQLIAGGGFKKENVEKNAYSGVFSTEAKNISLDSKHPKKTISLTYITPNGFRVEKLFTFYNDTYQIEARILTKNLKEYEDTLDYSLVLGPGLGNAFQKGSHKYEGPLTWLNGKKIKYKPKKSSPNLQGNISWTSMTSNYFVAAIIPQQEESEVFIHQPDLKTKDKIKLNQLTTIALHYPARKLAPKAVQEDVYKFYFGPKKYKDLQKLAINLEQVIDYGFFSFLAKPLIWLLNWFYKWIPNYGIAIILLTVLIKIIFWPLTDKSFRSMKDMQDLQPKLSALKEKHKGDPKKLNEELMGMYKQKGVNPMGGCLPLLLQIPVFFALYEGLLVAIELRGAPFMWWITDLAAMDPLLITPILMGVTMYIQQKMTPMTGEATQIKMMMMMPLIFTVFFLGFPSGLVIYWLLNNVLTIGQHYLILKKMKANEGV